MVGIVTVPLDLSPESDRALPIAVSLARQLGCPLELVVVTSPGLDTRIDEFELQKRAAHLGHAPIDTLVVSSNEVNEVLGRFARDPDRLVCCATHGRTAIGEWLFGSSTLAVSRVSANPVIAVGPRVARTWTGPVRTIVLAVDTRGVAPAAVDGIARLAVPLGAAIELVHVVEAGGTDELPSDYRSIDRTLGELVARFADTVPSRTTVRHGAHGELVSVLNERARQLDGTTMLAAVTHTTGRFERVRSGSATGRLLHRAVAPLLVATASEATTPVEPASTTIVPISG
jgi:nucleotide-binding universal stress UspA family protein